MERKDVPILEFDPTREALIEPANLLSPRDGFRGCAIAYFKDSVEALASAGRLTEVAHLTSVTVRIPIYETEVDGTRIHLVTGQLGAPAAAGQLEELVALGFTTFVVCGAAGVLRKDLAVGHLVVPTSAVRDEGTSYHYLPPSREVDCDPGMVQATLAFLERRGIPARAVKTWTTDAFYRETPDRVAARRDEGCATVEMEAAALFAVARFRGVALVQILYGGDDLSGATWDDRRWYSRTDVRRNLVDLSLELCAERIAGA